MREISKQQVIQQLISENRWWDREHLIPPQYSKVEPRPYLDVFYPAVKNRKVQRALVLMGPRRVGKTYLLHHVIQKLIHEKTAPQKICYVSVDHPIYNGLSLESFLEIFRLAG